MFKTWNREAQKLRISLEEGSTILDFGCGCGRVLQSFESFEHNGEIWGPDIDAEAIAWNREHLGHIAQFSNNEALPPTLFENGQFSAIFSVSVFTHLPEEMQFAWLCEMRRILQPGGIAIFSTHGKHCSDNARPVVQEEIRDRGFCYRESPLTDGLPDFYRTTFHSIDYIMEKLTRFFDVITVKEKYIHGLQDAVILKRRTD